MNSMANGLILLLQTVINIWLYLLLLRFLLQKRGADYFNPLIQVVVKLTDVFVKPVRRVIPTVRGYDLAIVTWLVILQVLSVLLALKFSVHGGVAVVGLLLLVCVELVKALLNIYFFALIIQVISSWVPSLQAGPVAPIVYLLVEPIMSRVRRWVPPIAGIDLSPIPVLIAVRVIPAMIFLPLSAYALRLVG